MASLHQFAGVPWQLDIVGVREQIKGATCEIALTVFGSHKLTVKMQQT